MSIARESEPSGTATLSASDVEVGATLPPMTIKATPTFVISTALATRDFQDVHHDRDAAVARGSKDIFLNILTDNGLVQRFVTDWAGPDALVRSIDIKLGVPCYAYDTLTFTGTVTDRVIVDGEQRWVVEVVGKGNLGDHVRGMVHIALPEVAS
ncbi:MaoC family dehydratase [Haloechinothrix halophila]|uniref:MaoC family dehydratase n=1 Tax=Haloechinothrix halophila TaxID=1069073 RepID=UPI0003FF0974